VAGAPTTVSVRRPDGAVEQMPLGEVTQALFEGSVPWRVFRWYRGQAHFSGSYWSATMQAPVGYESRLELANLLLADFDPRVSRIQSQPFLLEGDDSDRHRKHIPDYLLGYTDGSTCVVDVKPAARLTAPKVRESLDWSRRVVEEHGWEYRVECEPNPVLLANVRFLAGYRRHFQFVPAEVDAAASRLGAPITLNGAIACARAVVADAGLARSLVLHLLWRQRVRTDMTVPLDSLSVLEAR